MKIMYLLIALVLYGCSGTETIYQIDSGKQHGGNRVGISGTSGSGSQIYGSFGSGIQYSNGRTSIFPK